MALRSTLSPATARTDAKAFLAWLDAQAAVDTRRKAGTLGYCMSGPIAFETAATVPGRVGAVATFHAGGLVTDQPDSPHLLIPKTRAQFLVAIAENDDQKQPDAKDVLRQAFAKAGVTAEVEVYAGTLHGWCPPDSAVYNAGHAERAWERLLALFKTALA
jgi:carboxymethylenebutenolidase